MFASIIAGGLCVVLWEAGPREVPGPGGRCVRSFSSCSRTMLSLFTPLSPLDPLVAVPRLWEGQSSKELPQAIRPSGNGSFQRDTRGNRHRGGVSRSRSQGLCLAEPLAEGTEWYCLLPPKLCVLGLLCCYCKSTGYGRRAGGQDLEAQP